MKIKKLVSSCFTYILCVSALTCNVPNGSNTHSAKECSISYGTSTRSIPQHPRLLCNANDFKHLKKQIKSGQNEYLVKMHEQILVAAEKYGLEEDSLKFKKDASNRRILSVSRDALLRIFNASYAYRYTGDKRYLEAVEKNLNIVCDFPGWNPSHYLDVAEMTAAVSIGYDWCYKGLQPSTREKCVKALNEFAIGTADGEGFYTTVNNWNQVCNAGLVCAAIATMDSNPELSDAMIQKSVKSNMISQEKLYQPDGNYAEGCLYWQYGTGFETLMLLALQYSFGTDYGLSSVQGFDRTAEYVLFSESPTGRPLNFGDNGIERMISQPMWYFADRFSDPSILYNEVKKIDLYSTEGTNRLLPMYAICASRVNTTGIPAPSKKLFYGNGQAPIAIVHNGWESSDELCLAIKGGRASTSHGHMDAGSFIYEAYGVRWALDLGPEEYSKVEKALRSLKKNLWSMGQNSGRFKLFRYNNRQHNTLTVNDKDHCASGFAPIVQTYDTDEYRGAAIDFTKVFFDDLASAKRTAAIVNGEYLEVKDEILTRSDKGASIRWTMVGEGQAEITKDGIILRKNGVSVLLKTEGYDVKYKIWPSDPAAYGGDFMACSSTIPETSICGFETTVPAGKAVEFKTTITKL